MQETVASSSMANISPPDVIRAPLDEQRDALRDLVALASQCAQTEEQINRQFTIASEQAKKTLSAAKAAIENRFAAQSQNIEEQRQQKIQDIQAKLQSSKHQAEEQYKQACTGIRWDYGAAEKSTRGHHDEARLLTETGLDAAHNRAIQQKEALKRDLKAHDEAIAEIIKHTSEVLAKYAAAAPPLPELTAEQCRAQNPAGTSWQAMMQAQLEAAQNQLIALGAMPLPKFMAGILPTICLLLICGLVAMAAQLATGASTPQYKPIAIAAGSTLVVEIILYFLLRRTAKKQIIRRSLPIAESLALSGAAARLYYETTLSEMQAAYESARSKGLSDLERLKHKAGQAIKSLQEKRDSRLAAAKAALEKQLEGAEEQKSQWLAAHKSWLEAELLQIRQRRDNDLKAAQQAFTDAADGVEGKRRQAWKDLEKRLSSGLGQIQAPAAVALASPLNIDDAATAGDASAAAWENWRPPEAFPQLLPFGRLTVNLKQILDQDAAARTVTLKFPAAFDVPASLSFPHGASMVVEHDRGGRGNAIELLQVVVLRILACLPPGRVRLTLIDPVGLGQSFAGFMRLADYDDALVNGRIWTQPDQIEQRLSHMTEHMETVIQKYLRNEYPTIDDYNAQAGELAEPYRFLVVADFPSGFGPDALRRLTAIAATGARCGVYVLLTCEKNLSGEAATALEKLSSRSVTLQQTPTGFTWQDEVFGKFPLALDRPLAETVLTALLDKIGRAAKASQHVEVPFETIAPKAEEWWTGNSTGDLSVAVGRMGATRLQMLRLGKNVAQHGLLAGKTGSGKSTLLHVMVTNLAMWYSPDQVELYLIDFKKGVEFKTYATHRLPHARAIAVESDREFGLSVLERLDLELARRGELFRAAGVQDLPSYRKLTQQVMPRTVLVIDEFQEFFTEDDAVAQQAGLLLDRLVRQGRAFGVHLLLGSQTIGGTSGLARSTLGQMGVRIALQVSDADSQLILGDNNSAARLLSRPGAAIYNDAGGLIEANSPFQVAWLADAKRDQFLDEVRRRADAQAAANPTVAQPAPPVIFEGNAPADVGTNYRLKALLSAPTPAAMPAEPAAWIGEPVAIKEAVALTIRRQSGANVMLVGQQEEQALAVTAWMLISLAAQYPAQGATFHVLDGTPAGSPLAGVLPGLESSMRSKTELVPWRAIPECIDGIAKELARRQKVQEPAEPAIFLVIYGLQRYRMLRKAEGDFGFGIGSTDEEQKADPGKQFLDIIRDGPPVGIHVITWVDTMASIERTFDRGILREFDHRILFQMSAADSSTLIDSVAANKLGFYRALLCSEEHGTTEKFRPYGLPQPSDLLSA